MFLCKWRARKQISLHRDNKVVSITRRIFADTDFRLTCEVCVCFSHWRHLHADDPGGFQHHRQHARRLCQTSRILHGGQEVARQVGGDQLLANGHGNHANFQGELHEADGFPELGPTERHGRQPGGCPVVSASAQHRHQRRAGSERCRRDQRRGGSGLTKLEATRVCCSVSGVHTSPSLWGQSRPTPAA